MERSFLQNLIRRYYDNTITDEERRQLFAAMETDEENLKDAIAAELADHEAEPAFQSRNYDSLIMKVMQVDDGITTAPATMPIKHIPLFNRSWFKYAAAIVLLVIAGYWLYLSQQPDPPEQAVAEIKQPVIAPGKEGAILTLSDGKELVLDSLGNGIIADQQGTKITLKNGQLGYDASAASESKYNKMTTPRGRQFHLKLPDGTSVWLNASSSITYPTAFTGKERTVFITGEVYFDVAQNARQPFRVKVNDQLDVEVLGTEFNVNAYTDENAIRTTLLTGKIRAVVESLKSGNIPKQSRKDLVLKPGQQVIVSNEQQVQLKENVNLNKVMAWRKGYFDFTDADVPEIMRQLQRWYDIEVEYEGAVPNKVFSGKVGRDLNLADVLDILKQMELKYRLEGRKLVITQ
jgi:transmembrane sensor